MKDFEKSISEDYKAIGRKLQSGEDLNDGEVDAVFSVVFNYTDELIESRLDATDNLIKAEKDTLLEYYSKSQAVKNYLSGVVLGRIVRFYDEDQTNGKTESKSITRFNELKTRVCTELSICDNIVEDKTLNNFIKKLTTSFLDRHYNDEIEGSMTFVRKASALIISNNPVSMTETEHFKLD
jgi:hypothetical protein